MKIYEINTARKLQQQKQQSSQDTRMKVLKKT